MSWLAIIGLALLAFIAAALILRMPRSGYMLFGATLLFGLTGYALQGEPGMPGSPKPAKARPSEAGFAMIDSRRALFDSGRAPGNMLILADGFARRGRHADAAEILRGSLRDAPQDAESWVALGNALVEHAQGQLTPASLYAYGRADAVAPGHPGAPYFLGVALIRSGQPGQARGIWAELLAGAPADATWREPFAQRLARLDELLARIAEEGGGPMPSQAPSPPAQAGPGAPMGPGL